MYLIVAYVWILPVHVVHSGQYILLLKNLFVYYLATEGLSCGKWNLVP